jgi:hypothetical protein
MNGITLSEEERKLIYDFLELPQGSVAHLYLLPKIRARLTRDQPPKFCEWKRDGAWLRSPHGRMSAMAYGLSEVEPPKYCQDCGLPIKETT